MKKIVLLLLVMFALGNVFAWDYPVKEIWTSFCDDWSNLCIRDLPIIENADYMKYKNDYFYRSVYTVLWSASYRRWWDMGMGSHQWIDIASKQWTRIYSINDGVVVDARFRWEWWNVIVIKHEVDGKVVHSSYAHLDEMFVKVWQEVKKWDMIATIWNTGNSTWPHLHFQIDINQDGHHPFFPRFCDWSIGEIVNEWRCQNQILENTVDPILFIEKQGNVWLSMIAGDFVWWQRTAESFSRSETSLGDLIVIWWTGGIVDVWGHFVIWVASRNNMDADEFYMLDQMFSIEYDEDVLSISPSRFWLVGNGRRINVRANKVGLTRVVMKYGDDVLRDFWVFVRP